MTRAVPGAAAALLLVGLSPLAAREDSSEELRRAFDRCEAALSASSRPGYDEVGCFYTAARSGPDEALDAAAVRLSELAGSPRLSSWPELVLGMVSMVRGDSLEETSSLFEDAAEGFSAIEDPSLRQPVGEVLARHNLYRIYMSMGRATGAQHQVTMARRAVGGSGSDPSSIEALARVVVLEAAHHRVLGRNLGKSYRDLQEVVSRVVPDGPKGLQRSALGELGSVSVLLGRTSEAVAAFERLLPLHLERGDVRSEILTRLEILNALLTAFERRPRSLDREELALDAEQIANAARAAERPRELARALAIQAALAPLERSRSLFDECVSLAESLEDQWLSAECQWPMARRLAASESEAARTALEGALDAVRRRPNLNYESYVWQSVLRTARELDPRPKERAIEALRAIERVRGAQTEDGARIEVLTNWAQDYRYLIAELLRDHDARREALHWAERMRARSLLETLVRSEIVPSGDTAASVVLDGSLADSLADLEELQRELEVDEALISFSVGLERDHFGMPAGGSWALALTQHESFVWQVADQERLEAATGAFIDLQRRGQGDESATALYRLLFEGLKRLPPTTERLVIVADGVLHRLPFGALRESQEADPLGVRYEVSVSPSATLWLRWRSGDAAVERADSIRALVFADPELAAGAVRATADTRQKSLQPLPAARREGRSVCRRLGRRCDLFSGSAASEAALKSAELRSVGLLHFATHAFAVSASPERSAVVLAADEGEDGLLGPREIAALDLAGQAVVLSACDSAEGPVVGGEGVLSLSRSFFAAGAQAVVATRWQVDDLEAAQFVGWLYQAWSGGVDLSSAMLHAKRESLRQGLSSATWASFVLQGNGDLTLDWLPGSPSTRPLPGLWSVLTIGALLVVGAFLLRRSRARAE